VMKTLTVKTSLREEFIDITDEVENVVKNSGVKNGICYLYVPHTTAGITINEGADISVKKDIITALKKSLHMVLNIFIWKGMRIVILKQLLLVPL